MNRLRMIHLVGPGGAGKTTTGALLAERLGVTFVDLDDEFMALVPGGIGGCIKDEGYLAYAARNVALYSRLTEVEVRGDAVFALSSGFMTYPIDIHPAYGEIREQLAASNTTFVLLPSLDIETCASETVRRQMLRPFTRGKSKEDAVIRERFRLYAELPARKVETMRPASAVVDELVRLVRDSSLRRGSKTCEAQPGRIIRTR